MTSSSGGSWFNGGVELNYNYRPNNLHRTGRAASYPQVVAEPGLVVEVVAAYDLSATGDEGFVGAVVGWEKAPGGDLVRLEDRHGATRVFTVKPGAFMVDGQRVSLTRFLATPDPAQQRSNSGSRKVSGLRARVAQPSRIWVEGIHDAAIIEKVWGHDLRVEGVAVEYLEGLDHLSDRLREFQPRPGRRVGVLADHLLEGTKEMKLTRSVGEHVMVTGHPFVDIWAAVKPAAVGISAWPDVPRNEDWKSGIVSRLGWHDVREGFNRVYNAVNSYKDLDSTLVGAVERLIDFVTNPDVSKDDLV